MIEDSMADSALHQAAVAIASAHVMQFIKTVPGFGWVSNPIVSRVLATGMVFFGALGVHLQMSGTLDAGGSIILAWPMLSVMIDATEHMIIQWALQEGYYQRFLKPQASTPVTFQNPPPHAPEPVKT